MHASVQAVRGTDSLLFINDHWRAAIEARAYGLHLGQEDLDALTLIPGGGKKTAARMILELREKLALPELDPAAAVVLGLDLHVAFAPVLPAFFFSCSPV